jgi:glyoxylase-like metal-dependent hydrolase (beta-lactamase superfamily II)
MRVSVLKKNPEIYTCQSYLVRGNWNTIPDMNTLIDIGTDAYIRDEVNEINTGVGKKRVAQVFITHEHFDHAGGIKAIREEFDPVIYAYKKLPGVDEVIANFMQVQIGDQKGVVISTPGHSNDSICIYCEEDKVLFSGDTPLYIKSPGGTYIRKYVEMLEFLHTLEIDTIYSGHDIPLTQNAKQILSTTLKNVKQSRLVD